MIYISAKIRREIINIFSQYIGSNFLLIAFGSLVRREGVRSSDIDLAVYNNNLLSTKRILEIKEELDAKVHTLREIDLVNLADKSLDINFLKNILEGGIIWHAPKNSKELLKNLRKRLINIKK